MASKPWSIDHFRQYASLLVFDDGKQHTPEDWQLAFVEDLFDGRNENWLITPEGNGKTSFTAILALYGADFSESPWIPVAAASAKQARILHNQAGGFIRRTPGLLKRFRVFDGYLKIASRHNGGTGIEVFAADPKTGDGVIPYPFAIVDEGHRLEDMRLYGLWKGKLRKRGGQIIMLSTAGEPETPFEKVRDEIRRRDGDRKRDGAFMRVVSNNLVMHEFMVQSDEECSDMQKVKQANPLSNITVAGLEEDFASETLNLSDWKRLKCNRPQRSISTAITDAEWDNAEVADGIPVGAGIDLGLDVAFKWDTTAFVPLYKAPHHKVLGEATILVPPRDGSMLHPDEIKAAFTEIGERYEISTMVMDVTKAEDLAAWFEAQGITVIEWAVGNKQKVADYEAFMSGLRNGELKHTGDAGLRSHVLNAIARKLPLGDYRFDRPISSRRAPGQQDKRVIDALDAAASVYQFSTRDERQSRSVYEDRDLAIA